MSRCLTSPGFAALILVTRGTNLVEYELVSGTAMLEAEGDSHYSGQKVTKSALEGYTQENHPHLQRQ